MRIHSPPARSASVLTYGMWVLLVVYLVGLSALLNQAW